MEYVTMDGSNVKTMRLLEPQGEPDVIECDGKKYLPERTCRKVPGRMKYGRRMPACSECGYSLGDDRWFFCPKCGSKIKEEKK